MFVTTEQIQVGTTNFIEQEIAKKAVGKDKFFIYFAMPIIKKKVVEYVNAFSTNEMTKFIFDENNNVNLDEVYSMAKDAIKKSGSFVLYNIIFNETDVDKLYTYIKNTSSNY